MVVVQIADGWVSRAGTRATHPPTHSALRAGPRCWQSSEYRASPAPRFNSEGRGAGDRGGSWSRTRASCSFERKLAPHRLGDNHHGSGSPPVFINLVTGKARYSEPCLSRGPARSAEWVGGWLRRTAPTDLPPPHDPPNPLQLQLTRVRREITSAIPPRMASDAKTNLPLNVSPSSHTPASAATTGTLSCTVAARVASSPRSAVYQIAYPPPEVTAPETRAQSAPRAGQCARPKNTALASSANGTARRKLPAVLTSGSPAPRPRKEYTPHAIPAVSIAAAASAGGACTPGQTNHARPPSASARPAIWIQSGRSPRRQPQRIMLACTAPNRSSAPVPAVSSR